MFFNYFEVQQKQEPTITFYKNGSINGKDIKLKLDQIKKSNLGQLHSLLSSKLELQENPNINKPFLRLYDDQGVEIYPEDIQFFQKDQILYVSEGEEFDPSSCFSEYVTIKELGEGGFGKVLLGQHKRTREKCAIKIINSKIVGNASVKINLKTPFFKDIDMVFREAEMLKSLRHRNIVQIYKCYTLANMQVVFIMEYLEGGELLQYLEEKGRLSEYEARIFFQQIIEAVNYCHQQKLIHRDLKLENILLAHKNSQLVILKKQSKIKIVDFGIAGLANNFNVDQIDVGSLKYMAPEAIRGKNTKIGPQLDIWSLGVILFILVTGQMPFEGKDTQEVRMNIQNTLYHFPIHLNLSMEIKDLISRIFIFDPNKRIKLLGILDHQWVNTLSKNDDSSNQQKPSKVSIPRETTVKFADSKFMGLSNSAKVLEKQIKKPISSLKQKRFDAFEKSLDISTGREQMDKQMTKQVQSSTLIKIDDDSPQKELPQRQFKIIKRNSSIPRHIPSNVSINQQRKAIDLEVSGIKSSKGLQRTLLQVQEHLPVSKALMEQVQRLKRINEGKKHKKRQEILSQIEIFIREDTPIGSNTTKATSQDSRQHIRGSVQTHRVYQDPLIKPLQTDKFIRIQSSNNKLGPIQLYFK